MGQSGSNNDASGGAGDPRGRDGSWTDPTSDAARAALLLLAELPAHLRAIEAGLGDQRLDGVRDVARIVKSELEKAVTPEFKQAARTLLAELDEGGAISPLRAQVTPLVDMCREAMGRAPLRADRTPGQPDANDPRNTPESPGPAEGSP